MKGSILKCMLSFGDARHFTVVTILFLCLWVTLSVCKVNMLALCNLWKNITVTMNFRNVQFGNFNKSSSFNKSFLNQSKATIPEFGTQIEKYLEMHRQTCQKNLKLKSFKAVSRNYCDCIPSSLLGRMNNILARQPVKKTLQNNSEITVGGHWEPNVCIPRHTTVVIIPFRDRQAHLLILLHYLHPILMGQQLNYTIIVVEQQSPKLFNKAALMNAGYLYASKLHNPDCVIFHDVDMIPEDGRHFYTCRGMPVHFGAFHSKYKYKLAYGRAFGGVTAFRPVDFEKVNGFSNRFFGWGREDDDMSQRLRENKLSLLRDPPEVAKYTMIKHKRDKGNIQHNMKEADHRLKHDRRTKTDGLNTLLCKSKEKLENLYTLLIVNILNKNL